ncbi:MAG: glutamate 5-kinase [Campylobacter sp.]|nr:glutamate 5-kinase [Campylobacter sp.]
MRKQILSSTKSVVIKVGTSTLTNSDGSLNEERIKSLVLGICELIKKGFSPVLVSSGAVGAGMGILNIAERPKSINAKQALAAVGQVALMHLYERIFWAHSRTIAQLLLTKSDFSDRKRYLNVRNVCNSLISQGIVPIINENDPVVADELKVGDNDTLSALVAGLIDAEILVILSDINGLYDKNPNKFKDAKLISLVNKIDDNIKALGGDEGSKFGTGGMATKLIAAQMANKIGTNMIIANGKEDRILQRIFEGEELGTLFMAQKKRVRSKKFWLAYASAKKGKICIDEGASLALKKGKSLLCVGIKCVHGEFERGDIVEIECKEILARGISNYSSKEISLIMGKKSEMIEKILGYKSDDDIIHADNIAFE